VKFPELTTEYPALKGRRESCAFYHFERARLNNLFVQAVQYPLVLVCAGAGYGKTSAVHDFTQHYQADTSWIQLSERDNVGARFWENFTHTLSQINESFAKIINNVGFPDTKDKLNQYTAIIRNYADIRRRVIVMDDFHFIEDPAVIRFIEHAFLNLPPGSSLFLISRSTPRINTAGLVSRGHIYNISEDDLRFTESELTMYFKGLNINFLPKDLYEIMQDTEGWAFAINLIARSYKKAPGYTGYLRTAMKSNIFRLMETEIWDGITENLQIFLIRLSLIGHLSVELITLLAGEEEDLIIEMKKQSAYIRCDSYINAYLIHPLFLEFLASKEGLLSQEQKQKTYIIAAEWCNINGFKIDALSYYEKIGDYESIVRMFIGSQSQIPYDIACYAAAICKRTKIEVFDKVLFLASTHMRAIMCQGLWEDAEEIAGFYEDRYIKLPLDNEFRKYTLSSIYYCWGISRISLSLKEDVYDFDIYFEKLNKCFKEPIDPGVLINRNPSGPWICSVGSSRKGAPEDFIEALKRSTSYLSHCYINFESGRDHMAIGELMFYRNDVTAAKTHFARGIDISREKKQFGLVHRALFYIMRLAVLQGDYAQAEQALKDMKANLDITEYYNRYMDYDISLCWYYCTLGLSEIIPSWLKDNFSVYAYASFIENFANQAKGRYCYATKDFPSLLSYIEEMKHRESYLFGRIEMLAIETCIHYKMKNKKKALDVFKEAYKEAQPNNIIMPFIELGKDMRTLASFALKEQGKNDKERIPDSWLDTVNRKASSYAKRLSHVITEFKRANGMTNEIFISSRESKVLLDLSHGLSRAEIAAGQNLSINAVKSIINSIYMKFGAENLADAIRIATERKMI